MKSSVSFEIKSKKQTKKFIYNIVPQNRDKDNNIILVNKFSRLNAGYEPPLDYCFGKRMAPVMIPHLCGFMTAALNNGIYIYIDSAYRSYEHQKRVFERYVQKYGDKQTYAAPPGASEHQTGLCVDILWDKPLSIEQREYSKEFRWLFENCIKYGFILRYPRGMEEITQYHFEPWHFRYIGKDMAMRYSLSEYQTLEQFLSPFVKQ